MFSCEVCEISKNTFFTEHFQITASKFCLILRVWFSVIGLNYAEYQKISTLLLFIIIALFKVGVQT